MRRYQRLAMVLTLSGWAVLAPEPARAEVTWPEAQLLPSFSAPAPKQELIYLRAGASTWQAEGNELGHATGQRDGDGWRCRVGVDQPGHMVYGPYEAGLPTGNNTARFRLRIDDNTTDDNVQVTLDVRDSTSGVVLATQAITRRAFSVANDWVTFNVPFSVPAPGHAIETRVHWAGSATIKVDSVGVERGSEDELPLFASLKGVVNAKQPRIFSYEGDAFAEGPHTWLESLGLTWTEHQDPWPLITQFKSELGGVIVYDPLVPDTLNLATTLAGPARALVASPKLAERLSAAPYGLPILQDLRGKFGSKLAVYQSLLKNQWPGAPQRVLIGLSPQAHKAALREYAVALGAAVVWLDPRVAEESELLNQFLTALGPGGAFMGWWPEEGSGVRRASEHGVATVASDYAANLTVHGGMPRAFEPKVIPPKPRLESKRYVAFILSDGDNLQFVEHLMRKLWNDPGRGQVPLGWTVSPAMLDAMPGALAYYASTAAETDNLISGPSGWGYAYPNAWPNETLLQAFVRRTDDYARRSGLRVVTVWNTITGGIDADVGRTFAAHAPSLLGLTAQNTGGGLTVYSDALPGFALSCNYCTGEQAMKEHIAAAAANWDGEGPRFILIQAQPWNDVRPSTFQKVRDSLDDSFQVVRPDHWFQLLRQANGLRVEPIDPITEGVYRLVSEASGKCLTLTSTNAVEQAECDNVDEQRWRFEPTDAGFGHLTSVVNEQLRLDLEGDGSAEDARARVLAPSGSPSQQWQPIWEKQGLYHVLSRASDRCLDVPNGTSDDAPLRQWSCNGSAAQQFRFGAPVLEPEVGGSGSSAGSESGGAPSGAGAGGGGAPSGGVGPGAVGGSGGVPGTSGSDSVSEPRTDGSCGCRVSTTPHRAAPWLAALALLLGRRRQLGRRGA